MREKKHYARYLYDRDALERLLTDKLGEQVLLSETVTGGNDLGGYPLPTTTTTYQYDAFNNATQIAVSVDDGSSKTTNNTFTNDTTNWFLGRLTASSVTSTAEVPQDVGP